MSVTADGSLLSPTGGVNTIHPEPEIHEQYLCDKRLRNIVHDYKHILTYIETNVTNNVNNTTHTDELTVQHWAHCTPFVDESSNVFTLSHWLKGLVRVLSLPSHPWTCALLFDFSSSLFLSTSCSTSPSSSSCFSPWRTGTPWINPCATPQSGASSPWTIACPTQIVWPFFSFSLRTSQVVWFTGCIGFSFSFFLKQPVWLFFCWLLCPSTPQGMHLAAALENSTLRRILNFFSSRSQVSP